MKPILLAAFVLSVGASVALAQSNTHSEVRAGLTSMDTDGDGSISRAEAEAARGRTFDRLDANHDGRLTHAERREAHVSFGMDNTVDRTTFSRQQFMNQPYTLFDRTDTNHDGMASAEEIRRANDRHVQDPGYY